MHVLVNAELVSVLVDDDHKILLRLELGSHFFAAHRPVGQDRQCLVRHQVALDQVGFGDRAEGAQVEGRQVALSLQVVDHFAHFDAAARQSRQ